MTSAANRTDQRSWPVVPSKPSSARRFFELPLLCALLFCSFLLWTPASEARDLTGRLGLGYNSEFANYNQPNGAPGISVKYGITRDLGIEGVVGVSTESPTNTVVGLKFFKNIFYETNLNFYFMAGGGLVEGNSKTGTEILTGFGVEWFFPGLESLGFAMETGGEIDNLSGNFNLRTLGVSFLNAGIHFYF